MFARLTSVTQDVYAVKDTLLNNDGQVSPKKEKRKRWELWDGLHIWRRNAN